MVAYRLFVRDLVPTYLGAFSVAAEFEFELDFTEISFIVTSKYAFDYLNCDFVPCILYGYQLLSASFFYVY